MTGEPIVLENIFTHEGATSHEIIFAADVRLPPNSLQGQSSVAFVDGGGGTDRHQQMSF